MTLTRNWLYSLLLVIGGISVESLNALPPRLAAYAIPILMLIQAVISHRAHRFNPDGTPATQRYDPSGNGMFLPRKGGDDGFLG